MGQFFRNIFRLADWVVNTKVEIAKWRFFFRCFETSTVEIDIDLVLKWLKSNLLLDFGQIGWKLLFFKWCNHNHVISGSDNRASLDWSKWIVKTTGSGRWFIDLDGPKNSKRTVCESGWSWYTKNGSIGRNWTVLIWLLT